MAKHLTLTLADRLVLVRPQDDLIANEAALDGIYIVRTGVELPSRCFVDHGPSLLSVAIHRTHAALIGCDPPRLRRSATICNAVHRSDHHAANLACLDRLGRYSDGRVRTHSRPISCHPPHLKG